MIFPRYSSAVAETLKVTNHHYGIIRSKRFWVCAIYCLTVVLNKFILTDRPLIWYKIGTRKLISA